MRMCKSYVVVGGWLDNQHITVNNNGMLKGPCHKMFGKLFPLTLSDVSMFMLNRLSNYFKYVFFLRDNQQERCKVLYFKNTRNQYFMRTKFFYRYTHCMYHAFFNFFI